MGIKITKHRVTLKHVGGYKHHLIQGHDGVRGLHLGHLLGKSYETTWVVGYKHHCKVQS